jgi:hypothetical protein
MSSRSDIPITLLIEPPREPQSPPPPGATFTPARVLWRYDAFAEAIEKHTPARVRVAESFLREVPKGLVLLHYRGEIAKAFLECAAVGEPDVAKRVFLLNVKPSAIIADLDSLGVAGAISVLRYLSWRSGDDLRERAELHGLRALPRDPSLRIVKGIFDTARYQTYEGEAGEGLPDFLARYLDAYWDFHAGK